MLGDVTTSADTPPDVRSAARHGHSSEEKGVQHQDVHLDVAATATRSASFNTKFHLESKTHYEVDRS